MISISTVVFTIGRPYFLNKNHLLTIRVACATGCACMIAYSSSSALVPPLISNSSLLACQLFVIFKQVFVASKESPVHPIG